MDEKISTKEAAQIMNISEETLRRWEENGKLGFTSEKTSGGHRKFSKDKILEKAYLMQKNIEGDTFTEIKTAPACYSLMACLMWDGKEITLSDYEMKKEALPSSGHDREKILQGECYYMPWEIEVSLDHQEKTSYAYQWFSISGPSEKQVEEMFEKERALGEKNLKQMKPVHGIVGFCAHDSNEIIFDTGSYSYG